MSGVVSESAVTRLFPLKEVSWGMKGAKNVEEKGKKREQVCETAC